MAITDSSAKKKKVVDRENKREFDKSEKLNAKSRGEQAEFHGVKSRLSHVTHTPSLFFFCVTGTPSYYPAAEKEKERKMYFFLHFFSVFFSFFSAVYCSPAALLQPCSVREKKRNGKIKKKTEKKFFLPLFLSDLYCFQYSLTQNFFLALITTACYCNKTTIAACLSVPRLAAWGSSH